MEFEINQAIVKYGSEELLEYSDVDVVIVGAGPSGLTAGKYLAEKGLKVCIYERRLSVGGGIGGGGSLFPKVVVQEEVIPILKDFNIRYKKISETLCVLDPAEFIAKLTASAIDSGARVFLGVDVEDVIVRENPPRVCGVLWKWSAITLSGLHVDPLFTRAKAVVDATGHDAEVIKVASQKNPFLNIQIKNFGSNFSEVSEELVVKHTGKVAQGLYVTGIATCTVFGLPRMGPIFGGMLKSGKKVAEIILEDLKNS